MSLWGYKDAQGRVVATCPDNMTGNSGWEEVPEDTIPEVVEEPTVVPEPTIEERTAALETATQQQAATLDEVVTILEAIV